MAITSQENILELEVSINDPLAVEKLDAKENLGRVELRAGLAEDIDPVLLLEKSFKIRISNATKLEVTRTYNAHIGLLTGYTSERSSPPLMNSITKNNRSAD